MLKLNIIKLNQIVLSIVAMSCLFAVPVAAQPVVQSFGDSSINPAQRGGESSILLRDDQPQDQPNDRSTLTARPQRDPQSGSAGFAIPANPTADDFMNPADGYSDVAADDQDRSSAVGTFAFQSRGEPDQFAAPQPPLKPNYDRPESNLPTTNFGRLGSNDRRPSISENGLRPNVGFVRSQESGSDLRQHQGTGRIAPPAIDRLTATRRFSDSNPAPPAAMPQTREGRFNSNLSSTRADEVRSLPVHQTPLSNRLTPQMPTSRPAANSTPLANERIRRDERVRPTSFNQPPSSQLAAPADKNLASMIVERYSMDNATEALPGEPISLVEMMQQPLPVPKRQVMVNQYWETWFDWASAQNATAYQDWLESIPAGGSSADQGLLAAARSSAENEVLAAEIQLGKSQSKLIGYMPRRQSGLLPLPSDLPLVKRYETHYELYESRRMLPPSLRGINVMLSKTLTLISSRAKTVQMSQAAIKQTLDGYQSRQTSLGSVLEAARVWRSSEEDLLASITSYNQAIADYAMNITRRYTTPEQAVAMLIGPPKIKTQESLLVRQTSMQQNVSRDGSRSPGQSFGNQAGFGSSQSSGSRRTASRSQGGSNGLGQTSAGRSTGATNWSGGSNPMRSNLSPSSAGQASVRPSLSTSNRDADSVNGTFGSTNGAANASSGGNRFGLGNRSPKPPSGFGSGSASSRPTVTPPAQPSQRTSNQFGSFGG